jgi:predicted transcriptional regulator of viral defense system
LKPAIDKRSTLARLKLIPALFRKQDVEKVTPHAAVFLSRALKKGLVHRLNRGNYVNSFLCGFPRVEEAACFMRPPAYVTGEWALNYHGISAQSPVVCTAATLGSAVGRRHRVEYQGVTIEFSKISPTLFLGSPESIISIWPRLKKPSWIRSISEKLCLLRMSSKWRA